MNCVFEKIFKLFAVKFELFSIFVFVIIFTSLDEVKKFEEEEVKELVEIKELVKVDDVEEEIVIDDIELVEEVEEDEEQEPFPEIPSKQFPLTQEHELLQKTP